MKVHEIENDIHEILKKNEYTKRLIYKIKENPDHVVEYIAVLDEKKIEEKFNIFEILNYFSRFIEPIHIHKLFLFKLNLDCKILLLQLTINHLQTDDNFELTFFYHDKLLQDVNILSRLEFFLDINYVSNPNIIYKKNETSKVKVKTLDLNGNFNKMLLIFVLCYYNKKNVYFTFKNISTLVDRIITFDLLHFLNSFDIILKNDFLNRIQTPVSVFKNFNVIDVIITGLLSNEKLDVKEILYFLINECKKNKIYTEYLVLKPFCEYLLKFDKLINIQIFYFNNIYNGDKNLDYDLIEIDNYNDDLDLQKLYILENTNGFDIRRILLKIPYEFISEIDLPSYFVSPIRDNMKLFYIEKNFLEFFNLNYVFVNSIGNKNNSVLLNELFKMLTMDDPNKIYKSIIKVYGFDLVNNVYTEKNIKVEDYAKNHEFFNMDTIVEDFDERIFYNYSLFQNQFLSLIDVKKMFEAGFKENLYLMLHQIIFYNPCEASITFFSDLLSKYSFVIDHILDQNKEYFESKSFLKKLIKKHF